MKTSIIAFLAAALFACGAPPEQETPGQEGRIDGSVYDDGWFNSPEAKEEFCLSEPDAWFCSEIGQSEQAWTTHLYHGYLATGDNELSPNCYGPASTNSTDCKFPRLKQMRVSFNDSACYDYSGHANPPTAAQAQAMTSGFIDGILHWNGKGAGVAVRYQPTNPPSWYLPVSTYCVNSAATYLAAQFFTGAGTTQVNDLPTASGKNARKAIVFDSGSIMLNYRKMWDHIRSLCSTGGLTDAEIYRQAFQTGMHEMGHQFGFGHYALNTASNVMYAGFSTCETVESIGTVFQNALSAYDSTAGAATIVTGNLGSQTPN